MLSNNKTFNREYLLKENVCLSILEFGHQMENEVSLLFVHVTGNIVILHYGK